MSAEVIVQSIDGTKFGQQVRTGDHVQFGDEPSTEGGSDLGPTPYEYLLSALGT